MRTDADIVLDILRTHNDGITSSWDWLMDLKFAKEIKDKKVVEILEHIGGSVLSMNVHYQYVKYTITNRRLKGLRKLVNMGLVKSYWVGTGYGGRADFGINRLRGYEITPKGREDGEG